MVIKWKRLLYAVVLAITAPSSSLRASDYEAIAEICRASRETCLLYFIGLTNGLMVTSWFAEDNNLPSPFCIPYEVNANALANVVIQYIDSHPENWHMGTANMGYRALYAAYPCR
ncbi:Rap1a/Tai family immunity protein [Bauldia litoralis]|uniref:Rap1a/Tai family immunity protein n=1 Tax=Bauldia litoralis TaxID=665467 RepID=UPI003D652A86